MNPNLKLKALARLVQSESENAIAAVSKEFDKAEEELRISTNYENLEYQIKLINILKIKQPDKALNILVDFTKTIQNKVLTYEESDSEFVSQMSKYHNQESLLIEALEVIEQFRYFNPKVVFETLIKYTVWEEKSVNSYALEALKRVAAYNIPVISNSKLGFLNQEIILNELKKFDQNELIKYFDPVLIILSEFLKPEMEGTSWESYDTLTFSRGALPANSNLATIRNESIELLKNIYSIVPNNTYKFKVLNSIHNSARTYGMGSSNEDFRVIVIANTLTVIEFYLALLKYENLPIIQKIEHSGYWLFFHAISKEVENAALSLEKEIALNSEYQIYKVLIGFEGVFGDWKELKSNSDFNDNSDEFRSSKIRDFIKDISTDNFDIWKQRILEFSIIKSNDLATFPKFYEFLGLLGKSHPRLAIQLVSQNHQNISLFLIPIVKSIWLGIEKASIYKCIESWIHEDLYLYELSKVFLDNSDMDFKLINLILEKSMVKKDIATVSIITSVSVSNFEPNTKESENYIDLFLKAINYSTELRTSNWVFDLWYRKKSELLISSLETKQIDQILKNLLFIKEIDYHAEEILYLIARSHPTKVIDYLCDRVKVDSKNSDFEAIPFEMYKLNEPLSKAADYLLNAIFELYKYDSYLFQFKGARLARIIFKSIDEDTENAIINFINHSTEHLLCAAVILRNYEGQSFTYSIVKAMIKKLPIESEYWSEIEMILESTGVVTGEFGFVEAYKNKIEQIRFWLQDPDLKVVAFTEWFISIIEERVLIEQKRAEEQLILRKHQFE